MTTIEKIQGIDAANRKNKDLFDTYKITIEEGKKTFSVATDFEKFILCEEITERGGVDRLDEKTRFNLSKFVVQHNQKIKDGAVLI